MATHPWRFWVLLPFLCLGLVAGGFPPSASAQAGGAPAKLTYSRTFKGSTPEYLLITVDSNGSGTFEGHKLDEAASSQPFQLSSATTERIFALAAQLHNFQSVNLDSRKKVANLGLKTLAYQRGEDVNRVVFNYTENRIARELVDVLDSVGAVEEHIATLEFEMKYDPLSLPQELLQIQIELNNKSLTDPEMLLPTLEKIAHGSRFLHLAQTRAQDLIEHFQPNP